MFDSKPAISESYFVGDAAGRKGDFSDTDAVFASKLGLKFFTESEFFSSQKVNKK